MVGLGGGEVQKVQSDWIYYLLFQGAFFNIDFLCIFSQF